MIKESEGKMTLCIDILDYRLFWNFPIFSFFISLDFTRANDSVSLCRAHHFILSFNTGQYEKFVDESTIDIIMYFFALRYLKGHQAVLFLHTNKKSHYHVHIVIDPVNFRTYKTFRYNMKKIKARFCIYYIAGFWNRFTRRYLSK